MSNVTTTDIESIQNLVNSVCSTVSTKVYGHENTTALVFGAFLLGGHVLIEGPPGIAKTLLAKTFASTLGLSFRRIQFTPDLMPSDITGVNVFDTRSASFHFVPGPLFSNIILADEINRTPPKTQAALLEAMEEHQTTIDGKRHDLGELFFVIATQNPIEHEGTFPLPEAQLDRFLFRLKLSYPSRHAEEQMIQTVSGEYSDFNKRSELESSNSIASEEQLIAARRTLRKIVLSNTITNYILDLVLETRRHPQLLLGASPRAGMHIALASKFAAAKDNRGYVIPDDVKSVFPAVLNHRILFNPENYDVLKSPEDVLEEVLSRVPVPNKILD